MSVSAEQALALLAGLAAAGPAAVVDGGWGIDALLGVQTRPHDDLDLVVAVADLPAVRSWLMDAGFAVERDLLPTALALRHPDGRGVDLHPVEPVAGTGGDQVLEDGTRWRYGPHATGRIGGREVRCVSAETQLAAHLGYEPDADDRADVAALCARFGLPLPPDYAVPPCGGSPRLIGPPAAPHQPRRAPAVLMRSSAPDGRRRAPLPAGGAPRG